MALMKHCCYCSYCYCCCSYTTTTNNNNNNNHCCCCHCCCVQAPTALRGCSWSSDGRTLMANCKDGCVYVWLWGDAAAAAGRQPASDTQQHGGSTDNNDSWQQQQQCAGHPSPLAQQQQQQQSQVFSAWGESSDWPAPQPLQRLTGHACEVLHAALSQRGDMLATASLDGCVQVGVLAAAHDGLCLADDMHIFIHTHTHTQMFTRTRTSLHPSTHPPTCNH
jgi:WD40 repeat protein